MADIPWISVIIFIMLAIGAGFAYTAFKIKEEEYKKTKKYPKGHYMSLGIALGIPLGIPIGVAMGNIAIGLPIGLALGAALGTGMEKKHEKELRPLTEKELKMKNYLMIFLGLLLVIGVIAYLSVFFVR